MKRVIIESPYAGNVARNLCYARMALINSLNRGEAPIASHLLYPQVLSDTDPIERAMGIEAGLAWVLRADLIAVYTDLGISPGMKMGIERAARDRIIVEYRQLAGWEK